MVNASVPYFTFLHHKPKGLTSQRKMRIIITKIGVITFIQETRGRYGNKTGYLFGSFDPA